MTDNTPPTQASSSTNPYLGNPDSQRPIFLPYSTSNGVLPYGNYSSWNNLWSSNYSGYATMALNPALHGKIPPYGTGYLPQRQIQSTAPTYKLDLEPSSSKPDTITPVRVDTPPLPEPDTYRHWDDVMKKFFEKTKLTECRRGFELDMLVLNPEWERRILPDALKDLVHGMQVILDRISGKTKDDPEIQAPFEPPLDERKLNYIKLKDGKKPEPQSSVTKSISQFIARSRARNDLSNRAEFLQTLAEKKQALTAIDAETQEVSSCARVDAKPIDREKQIKYDIMKNEDGPLTRTASTKPPASASAQSLSESAKIAPSSSSSIRPSEPINKVPPSRPRKRRRLTDDEDSSKNSTKPTKGQPPPPPSVLIPQDEKDGISTPLVPAIDERIRNIEDHLSVRYVPSPPQTLLTRLKYLEDHLIRLEKEYPPWAALHFKQPNRGWPPPPRSTPIIIPPHLRSTDGRQTTRSADSVQALTSISEGSGLPSVSTVKTKARHKNSTLHKAVMDRLEIQQAMNEMGIQ